MTTILLQYTTDAQQMLNSEIEKHQVHRIVSNVIVLAQSIFGSLDQLLLVEDFFVGAIRNTEG